MAGKKNSSPEGLEIRSAPLASARLSRKAALAAIGVGAVVLGFIIISVSKEPQQAASSKQAEAPQLQPALNAAKELTSDVPDIADTSKPVVVPELPVTPTKPPLTSTVTRRSSSSGPSREEQARLAGTEVTSFAVDDAASSAGDVLADNVSSLAQQAGGPLGAAAEAFAPGDNEPDLNRQQDKRAFLNESRKSRYIGNEIVPPRSPYELKTGTVIPGVLLSELNSDLPGEIVAQVAQNVYDTASGNHLLIPQGTKLFGQYDSGVAFGQSRLLVRWQRLIFPDASTLELDGMSGNDRGGMSGFAGKVNNHYGRIFGWALLTSVISAGYEISQPDRNNNVGQLTDREIASAAVGQQMAQLGTEIARRNLRVQPTIEIHKGYRMHVMVNQDIEFPGTYRIVASR